MQWPSAQAHCVTSVALAAGVSLHAFVLMVVGMQCAKLKLVLQGLGLSLAREHDDSSLPIARYLEVRESAAQMCQEAVQSFWGLLRGKPGRRQWRGQWLLVESS
jgi:hypothetical protein